MEKFLELRGRTVIPALCKTVGQNFKNVQTETKIVHQNKFFFANYAFMKFNKILTSNMIIIRSNDIDTLLRSANVSVPAFW